MIVLSNINNSNGVNYFKELPFNNKPIEKPKIKGLKNIDLLAELPFYEQLNITKTNQAFRVVENRAAQDTSQSLKVNFFGYFYIPFLHIFET